MAAKRTPIEIIQLYWNRVYNERDFEFLRELCADPIIRHDPGAVLTLSLDEQVARVTDSCTRMEPYFTHEVLFADDRYVCSVWNMFSRKGDPLHLSGIEVFEVEDGRFTHCWNSSYSRGYWGRDADQDEPLKPLPPRQAWDRPSDAGETDRTPVALLDRLWSGAGDVAAVCADPMACYGPAKVEYVDAAAIEPSLRSHEILLADGRNVCSVWNRTTGDGQQWCGIDVFTMEMGRLARWWSPPPAKGHWGREGDSAVPKDLPPPQLLASVDAIDNVWLQSVFQHSTGDVPRIALVTVEPLGHGNMSTTVHVTIGYNQAVENVPLGVVCKFNSTLAEAQEAAARFQPYRTEISAYRFFGPNPPMQTPRALMAELSDDGLTANLVLEDLGASCEAGDQVAGCGQAEAAAVVEQLARMHRHYWMRDDLYDLEWTAQSRRSAASETYASGVLRFRERYAAELGPENMAVIEAFAPLVDRWMSRQPENFTLIHTDPRVDNILFDRQDDGGVSAWLIDWQCVDVGDPQYDVAYFMSGSLSPEDRRACERRLVENHARMIAETDPAYTVEKALEAYRFNMVSGLYLTVHAVNVMPDTDHNRALLTTLARRNCAAVRDWDSLAAIAATEAAAVA